MNTRTPLPDNLFTLYGRQPVLEALRDPTLDCFRLHLARSNKPCQMIDDMRALATDRQVDIALHDKLALSRISRNSRQDQGVALDIRLPGLGHIDALSALMATRPVSLLALDNITNPQNVGMIIRSACAGGLDGIIIPKHGCAKLDPLVIKASAGTFFRSQIYTCHQLAPTLQHLQQAGATLALMDARANRNVFQQPLSGSVIYVLGNEHEGVSADISRLPHSKVAIPMHNGVESLNVAMTATVIAFLAVSRKKQAPD